MKRILISNQVCSVSNKEYRDLLAQRELLGGSKLNGDSPEYIQAERDHNDCLMAIEGRKQNQKQPIIHDIFVYV